MNEEHNSREPIVRAVGLTKVFKDFWMRPRVLAVDTLDMEIYPHEVFGLLGPNGSGKSTTIKMLLGLLFPTKGKITLFGRLPTDVAIKSRVGYLPEESYLYRFLNARETLEYYGRLFHIPREKRQKRIDELLEMVGLDAVQRRPVGEYSKGMARRIGLAQALINDPDFLILDEPTTGMDPIGTRQIKDLILRLKERGKTVLLSSHLLADVEDVCDRVTILYGGKKRREGTIQQLLVQSDATVIETDALSDATVSKVEALITQEEGKGVRKVTQPRQSLEGFFLDIVKEAQAEGVRTYGARSDGRVADFLSTDATEEGEALIQSLTQPKTSPVPEPSQPATAPSGPDEEVLESLTSSTAQQSSTSKTGQKADPDQSSQQPEADADVIDDLLGGGKKS